MSKAYVTIVIPNFNGKRHLETCLSSIRKLSYKNHKTILVDNASTDNSVDFVKSHHPEVRILVSRVNLGFAEGCNQGIRNAEGDFAVLLNNDVEVEPNWLERLVQVAQSDSKIAICASKIMMFENRKILNSSGGIYDIYGYAHDRGLGEYDHGQYSNVEEVFFASGGAMLVRLKALQKTGLFDSRYFMYGEDVDLCWRTRLEGYKVVYVPSAVVYHKYGGTMKTLTGRRLYLASRNGLCSIIKNYQLGSLPKVLPRFFGVKMGQTILFTISGRMNASVAIIKALLWNILNLCQTWKERLVVQSSRKVCDREIKPLLLTESIELSRFLKGYFPKFRK